jgi:hypothetical protein
MVESRAVAFYGREGQAASLLVFCESPTQFHSENFSAYHCYSHRLNHRAFVDDPGSPRGNAFASPGSPIGSTTASNARHRPLGFLPIGKTPRSPADRYGDNCWI